MVDLGAGVFPVGAPAAVAGNVEVPVEVSGSYGLWADGTVLTPTAPASDPTAKFVATAVNANGIVVGYASDPATPAQQVPVYWDSEHSPSFVEVSLSGLTANGQAVTSASFSAIDLAGEASGTGMAGVGLGIYAPAVGGLPAGQLQAVTALGGTTVSGLAEISAAYEGGRGTATGDYISFDRGTHTATDSGVAPVPRPGTGGFAAGGDIVGYRLNPSTPGCNINTDPGCIQGALYRPGVPDVALTDPGGASPEVFAVNSSGESVGTDSAGDAVTWDAHGAVTLLSSELPSGSSWTSLIPEAIDDNGDIDGTGAVNGQSHGFLVRVKSIVPPVVTSTGDAGAADPKSGSCDTGQTVPDATGAQVPECTLRAAIQAVNSGQATTTNITFDIPAAPQGPIKLSSALPALTGTNAVIDGTTEPRGTVSVDGTGLAGKGNCITVQAGGVTVRGLDLANCPTGIDLGAPGLDKVQDDVIGLDSSGAPAHGLDGVVVEPTSAGNLIGGPQPGLRDVISAQGAGVQVNGSHNLVQGNYLGTDASGTGFVPDQLGVVVTSTGNTVGGSTASPGTGAGNVIVVGDPTSKFDIGVLMLGAGNTMAGNLVGTDASGNRVYAPKTGYGAKDGVLVAAPALRDVVGGGSGSGNVIAGASVAQVELDGATAIADQVVGNTIGAGLNGQALPSPTATGVLDAAAASPRIGASGEGNTITGQRIGVGISTDNDEIDYTVTEIVDGQPTLQAYVLGATDAPAQKTNASVRNNTLGPLPGGEIAPAAPQQAGVVDDHGSADVIGPGNVVSFNDIGIQLTDTDGVEVGGNHIGTDRLGFDALPNGIGIVSKDTQKTQIGGAAAPDTISGNLLGILLESEKNEILGEKIGTNTRGTAVLKRFHGTIPASMEKVVHVHSKGGIDIESGRLTLIGGDHPADAVTIGGVDGTGITTGGTTLIYGARIGVTAGHHSPLPIAGDGVAAYGDTTIVGSVIAHSDKFGVKSNGDRAPVVVGTPIYDNGDGGIKINSRDAPKPAKLIRAVNAGHGYTEVKVEVDIPHGEKGLLELFASKTCQAHGAGEKVLSAEGDLNGKQTGITDQPLEPVGTAITALLTVTPHTLTFKLNDPIDHIIDGRTSVFSECTTVKSK